MEQNLELFAIQIQRILEDGLDDIRKTLEQKEIRLRSDLHNAIGGFLNLVRSNGTN